MCVCVCVCVRVCVFVFIAYVCVFVIELVERQAGHTISDCYYKLNRVILLRTGHTRLNAHLFNKMKIGQSGICP